MKKQTKDLKRRTLHNADAAYYVLDYLRHGFPTQLYERYTDESGNLQSRPVVVDGQPVHSKEAIARRDALIEKLASLPAVPSALDQIVQHFGTEQVAEVTGRSRRLVRKQDSHGQPDASGREPSVHGQSLRDAGLHG